MSVPQNLKYAKSHEWVRVEGGIAVVGISDHAQHELTDIVYVELPPVGDRVEAGKECAVVESVKAASDIYAPVTGDIVEVNEELSRTPELVNQDPYGKGWMFKVKLSDLPELGELMTPNDYAAHIGA
ncbi:MAG: glycine cleavage system protein GcvH [Verrucomicrobiota bacterium]|jgi:glycine cleavage system H protein